MSTEAPARPLSIHEEIQQSKPFRSRSQEAYLALLRTADDLRRRISLVLEPTGKITSLARVRRTGAERFELDTDAGHGEELLARLDRFKIRVKATTSLIKASVDAPHRNESERIELGWPAMGHELVAGETIPQGTGLTRIAVSFTKGCYPGQELVERMDSRGAEAPRTLRRLDVPEGSAQGDPVRDGDQEVGEITSVVATRALGWVKRSSGVGEAVLF